MKFDEAMARLEVIVKELDNQDLPLEKSIELFEEGLKLSTQTQSYLKSNEKRINKIVEEFQKEETNEEIN